MVSRVGVDFTSPEGKNQTELTSLEVPQNHTIKHHPRDETKLNQHLPSIPSKNSIHEVPERPNMWHIIEKRFVQGYQKIYFHVSDSQIQKKNTQIHDHLRLRL